MQTFVSFRARYIHAFIHSFILLARAADDAEEIFLTITPRLVKQKYMRTTDAGIIA